MKEEAKKPLSRNVVIKRQFQQQLMLNVFASARTSLICKTLYETMDIGSENDKTLRMVEFITNK